MNLSIDARRNVGYPTNRVIWLLWLQGWDRAPWVVRKCLSSWQVHNPDWDIRALDAKTVQRYVQLPELDGKEITAASMSDIIRMHLLHEYGGVWCDATLLCHRPLNSWLQEVMPAGFFAFDRPVPGRLLSSWFIAAEAGNLLINRWHASVRSFWAHRQAADDYFWLHSLFGELFNSEAQFRDNWEKVPKISADGPHQLQNMGLLEARDTVVDNALLSHPAVSKLTYRFDETRAHEKTLVSRLLTDFPEPNLLCSEPEAHHGITPVACLSVPTHNLSDYVQIIAGQRLIRLAPPSALPVPEGP